MNKITTIGLDLAKNVFHAVCCDARGKVVRKKVLRRAQLAAFFGDLAPCLVGMEACASAHHWARRLRALGHTVKLIPPQYVKPFVRGNKNDANDALAIAEAVVRPEMRFVAVKTVEQQDIQCLHRLRERAIRERTGLANQLRGLLGEYGMVFRPGVATLRRALPAILEDGGNDLSAPLRQILAERYRQLLEFDRSIAFYDQALARHNRQCEAIGRLMSVPGYGPVVASAYYAHVGNGEDYRRGRDVSASVGIVPRQHSSGGKNTLLGISKRGDRRLRSLLIHGARAVVIQAARKDDALSRWINELVARRGINKATVALANKMARMGWAVLRHQTTYRPA